MKTKNSLKEYLIGYSTEEVDDFLDEVTLDYEKIYKEVNESRKKIDNLNNEVTKFKQMEETLQSTLVMAQSTAEEMQLDAKTKSDTMLSDAKSQADTILNDAQTKADTMLNEAKVKSETLLNDAKTSAESEIARINADVDKKRRELEEMQKQFDAFKTNMEALLTSHMEILRNNH